MAINESYFDMAIDMDKVCRICLQENETLSNIFSNAQDTENLSEKIKICGDIECHQQDGFPSKICDVCIYKASIAHEFRQLCQHSDTRLRLYYNKPAKYSSMDSIAQTKIKTKILLSKAVEQMENAYFVKEEEMNNHQFHNAIESEVYNEEGHTMEEEYNEESHNTIEVDEYNEESHNTIEDEEYNEESQSNSVITITSNIGDEEEKLFDCHLNFEGQSKNANSSEMVSSNTEEVICTEELIPVSTNIIDRVSTMKDDINTIEAQEKDDKYFTYVKKKGSQQKNISIKQAPKSIVKSFNNDIEHNYFEPDNNSQDSEGKFKCDTCSKFYNTQKNFKKHQLGHLKLFKCNICSKRFSKLENLDKHKKIHVAKPHACKLCNTSYTKTENLVKHLGSHKRNIRNVIKQKISNNQKQEGVTKKNTKCNKDPEDEFTNVKESDEFENVPAIFKCEDCGQYCSTLKNLKRHSLIHGERKYSCTVCKKWFFRPDTLKKHAERHGHGLLDNLEEDNKLYDSDDDSFTLNNSTIENNNAKKNESDEESNGEYKCQHCDKVMATKKGLRRHVAMHKPKPEPAICEICNKVCASQARLNLHQKTHNKPKEKVVREYLCHICSKVYPSNSSLTYHMRTHTGVKPHVCKICNSGFTTTTSLANHIRIHTGDKPFVCHVCSAAFAVSSAFRRHLTRHTGEANYLCKQCGKAFKRLSTLKEHTYTHSGEKPYVCKTCGAAYSHSGSLFAHQKRCRLQCTETVVEDDNPTVAQHVQINHVQTEVRSLTVIDPMF